MKQYKCLNKLQWKEGLYKVSAIRKEDKEIIRKWRNDQIGILRQKLLLSEHEQERYFDTVIDKLFDQDEPSQILFSFFLHEELIGYGGLVHIDWQSKHAEISFLNATVRSRDKALFHSDMNAFFSLMSEIGFKSLNLHKLHTSVYDSRHDYLSIIKSLGFGQEAKLKDHVIIDEAFHDILIFSIFNQK